MNRRHFLTTAAGWAFITALLRGRALANPVRQEVHAWAKTLAERCTALQAGELPQREWQAAVLELLGHVDLDALLKAIDFEAASRALELPHDRAGTADVPQLAHRPALRLRLFGFAKGRAIAPHGHRNVASAHLVIGGTFHVRHYERVGEDAEHLLLRPSIDRHSVLGDATSICDEHDNVHWLVAERTPAWTLDFITAPKRGEAWSLDFVDISSASAEGGLLRAPRLSAEAALAKYA